MVFHGDHYLATFASLGIHSSIHSKDPLHNFYYRPTKIALKSFYKKHGFVEKGEEYLEDGIPHISMECFA